MPSGVTQPLYDGESMSFPEFASRTARVVAPWIAYEREAPLGAPLGDGFESDSNNFRKKWFHDDAVELARVTSWTPEEADAKAHTHNLSMLKSHLQSIRSAREQRKRYEFMSTQVAAWEAPTEEHEIMRTAMQSQLDETFGFYLGLERETPHKMTGQEYKEQTLRFLARKIITASEELELGETRVEQDSDFAKAFKDSLEGWQDVEVPKRILP